MALTEQIEQLEAKANKYDQLREMFATYNAELTKAITTLQAVQKQVAPFVSPTVSIKSTSSNGTRKHLTPYVDELLDKLNHGTHVTSDLVRKTYQDLNEQQVQAVMGLLAKRPNVMKTKDGATIRLYPKKEV
jgi:hypothetical protein